MLLVAAGRPDADLDLRGLADDGEVAILEIHLERLARDEKLLVSEHAELHLRGHVVLAAHQVELAFEDPAADVVGNAGEYLREEPGRLLDLLLVGLQKRELVEGLGLETTVWPPRELLKLFAGAVELPGEPVDLSHPQFSVGLAGRAVEFLGRRDPLVKGPGLGIFPAGQRDVCIGHEQAGLGLRGEHARRRLGPGEQELAELAGAVVVAGRGVLADEPGREVRIQLLVDLRHDGGIGHVELPGPLRLAGGQLHLRLVDRPPRIVPRHGVAAAEREQGVGADRRQRAAGAVGQERAEHLQAALGDGGRDAGLAGPSEAHRDGRELDRERRVVVLPRNPPESAKHPRQVGLAAAGLQGLGEDRTIPLGGPI